MDTVERLNRNLALMQAGSAVTIDVSTPAGQKAKFRTIFIGYLPKQYVLIQMPESNRLGNFSNFIVQGTAVTVRGLIEGHEGTVAAFISSIRQTLQIPSRIIVLDFPKTVSVQSLRNAVRIDANIGSTVQVGEEYWQATITDISVSGCQLLITNGFSLKIAKGDKLNAVIENFQDKENLKLVYEVCSTKIINEDLSLGVKFDPSHRESVIKIINDILIKE